MLWLFFANALFHMAFVNGKSVMQPGEFLTVNSFLVSPGETFELGFIREAENTSSGSSKYMLVIRFRIIQTVVWSVADIFTDAAILQLTAQGLLVSDNSGNQRPLASSSDGTNVASAKLEENGNFKVSSASGNIFWQSFDHPNDTLLPDQLREGTYTTDLGGVPILRSGSYYFYVNSNSMGLRSSAVIGSNSLSYWDVQRPPNTSFTNASSVKIQTNGILIFKDSQGPWNDSLEHNSYVYALDFGDAHVIRRLTLESNGNLRIYSLAHDNSSWSITWQAVSNECYIFGTCGPFGICTYRPTQVCTCPPGFHFIDSNNPSKGCTYNVPLTSCDINGIKWVQLDRADYTFNDYGDHDFMPLDECKLLCAKDCYKCLGIVYKVDGSGKCFLKGPRNSTLVLYNGVQVGSQNTVAFLKVSSSDSSVMSETESHSFNDLYILNTNATNNVDTLIITDMVFPPKLKLTLALAVLELVVFITAGILYGIHVRRNFRLIQHQMEVDAGPTRFTYHQLEIATNYFKQRLGAGGFGTVFRGVLVNGAAVAVKNIETATQTENQFQAEVRTLGKVHHVNLVRLIGYCAEGIHRMLVYEYMPNGSLEKILLSSQGENAADKNPLDWNARFSITLGIAKGVSYLHDQCQECILHCDIKPENVLLDEKFCPKVSDFGMAKLVNKDMSSVAMTTIRGTRGYMAPEWVHNVTITPKVDVYSFGMLLLELLSGRESRNLQGEHFSTWAFGHYVAGGLKSIADARMEETVDWIQFELLLRVSFWCIQPDVSLRPMMRKVVEMLEGNVPVAVPPFPKSIYNK